MFNIKILSLLIIISLVILCSCRNEIGNNTITEQDAENFISSYISTLKLGDTEEIKNYWSNISLNRHGFDVMHLWIRGLIHIEEWKTFLDSTQYTFKIKELLKEDDYYIINGEWIKSNDNSEQNIPHPMPFYLINENDKWLLINPIDVLTKNWNRYETDNIVFFYSNEINIDEHLHEVELLDKKYESMCKTMGFSFKDRIEYYKASSPEECGRLLTQPPFNGLAAVTYEDSISWFQIAVSTTFYNPHEVMHVISLSSGIPSSIPVFSEGLAVAYGGTSFQTAEYAHNYSKNILENTNYIPLKKLLTMESSEFLRLSYVTYQESGSFIRYLIDVHGLEKLKKFISNFNESGDLDAQSVKVYNVSLDELEDNWKKYLKNIYVPGIGFSIPRKAELVVSMNDPENDDVGDGDYKYPANEKYLNGCFDLTKFEIFQEIDSVYFRIELQKVIEPVSNRPGGTEFIPTLVIAINKGGENERQLYKYTNSIELSDGYDLKINVGFGINISNNLGKIFISTSDLYNKMANLGSNTLTFSLPIELIGEPEDDWKYFVGVGLADEPTFNFSGLIPVFKNISGLISGGNYNYSNPAYIDILLPEKIDQSKMLSNYDSLERKLALIKMISSDNF